MIERYSRKEIKKIWDEKNKYQIWLDIEIAAAQAMEKLKLIPKGVSAKVRKKAVINVDRIHKIESKVHHDMIAFLTSITEKVGSDGKFLHKGMTSSDVLDTCFNVQLSQASKIINKDIDGILMILKKKSLKHEIPTGMQGFFINSRQEIFKDPTVRKALNYAFDFEWTNKILFFDQYKRTDSFFSNSDLASSGLPSGEELKLLKPFKDQLPKEVFNKIYENPVNDGSGEIRKNLRIADKLLYDAGWLIKDGKRINESTGVPLKFTILLVSPEFERIALPYARNLKKIGIETKVRTVDSAQYERRLEDFSFDMTVVSLGQSLSPGNEQKDFWSSTTAQINGSRNYAGVSSPVVDFLIDKIIAAKDRKSLISATKALDRVLLLGYYVVPHWHIQYFRIAYWDKFGRPKKNPKYDLGLDTWWIDINKVKLLETTEK